MINKSVNKNCPQSFSDRANMHNHHLIYHLNIYIYLFEIILHLIKLFIY